MKIGEIIHNLRKEREMTLLELSNKSGVALATLSRIENGKMTGTLDSHMQIASALEVKLTDLYKDLAVTDRKVEAHTRGSEANVFVHDKRSTQEMLTSKAMNKKMMPILVRIEKGGETHKEETKIGIEKFVYVVEGKVDAEIGDDRYNLAKGDTLYFDGYLPHQFKNTGTGEARLLCVITPPSL